MANAPVSIRDVAAHAGVSVGTVSNVLNRPDVVAEPTRIRVLAAIKTPAAPPPATPAPAGAVPPKLRGRPCGSPCS